MTKVLAVAIGLFWAASASAVDPATIAAVTAALTKVVENYKDQICTLDGISRNANGGLAPADASQRKKLYLRCELMGGVSPREGTGAKSCCDHLTPADAAGFVQGFSVCPDEPLDIVVPARDALKLTLPC